MDPAPLPGGSYQDRRNGALQAPVSVAGYEPHPTEPSGYQRTQEGAPEGALLARTNVEAQNLPFAGFPVHPDGYDHRHRGNPPVLAGFDVGGVDPDVGVSAFERSVTEALHLLIQFLTKFRYPTLGDAAHPQRLHQLIHLAGGDAMDVGFLNDRRQCSLGLPTWLQRRGEVATVSDPGHLQLHRPHPRVPGALAVSVALPGAPGGSLMTRGPYVLFYLHLHECLGQYSNALLEEGGVLLDHRLAQQLGESYPQFIGHRAFSFGRLVSSEGTTRWPSSSTAFTFYTLTRTLPTVAVASPDTTLTPPRAPYGATGSKVEKGNPSKYAAFAIPCTPLQRLIYHSQLASQTFESARRLSDLPAKPP